MNSDAFADRIAAASRVNFFNSPNFDLVEPGFRFYSVIILKFRYEITYWFLLMVKSAGNFYN